MARILNAADIRDADGRSQFARIPETGGDPRFPHVSPPLSQAVRTNALVHHTIPLLSITPLLHITRATVEAVGKWRPRKANGGW